MLQRVSLQMFKYSRNTLPEVISELFITNDTFHSHNTRNKNKLRSKMSNREYMYTNFSFIGVYNKFFLYKKDYFYYVISQFLFTSTRPSVMLANVFT